MIHSASYDIIIAGLGGQGVQTLTGLLFELAHRAGRPCRGAVFKGGAQKAGTIHAELRILPAGGDPEAPGSNQILEGCLDLMLGLEPHEAMRFARYFGDRTRLIINDAPVPFDEERRAGRPFPDPVDALRRDHPDLVARDYTALARREHGDPRMANVLMLLEAAGTAGFPFTTEAVREVLRDGHPARPQPATHARGS